MEKADSEIPLRHILKSLVQEKPENSRRTEFDNLPVEERVSYFLDWVLQNRNGINSIHKEDIEIMDSDKTGEVTVQHKKLGIMGFKYFDKDDSNFSASHPEKFTVSPDKNLLDNMNKILSYVKTLYPLDTELDKETLVAKFSDILK